MNTSDPEVNVLNSEVVDPVSKMLQTLPAELNDEQREAVADLLYKYDDVFSKVNSMLVVHISSLIILTRVKIVQYDSRYVVTPPHTCNQLMNTLNSC